MIQASILLTFKDGTTLNYANKYLADKPGLLNGISGICYYYTGEKNDEQKDQTGAGKILGDFDGLKKQIGGTGNIKFPEGNPSHGETEEYIRPTYKDLNTGTTEIKKIFSAANLVSVSIIEKYINYPEYSKDRKEYEGLSKNSSHYIAPEPEDIVEPAEPADPHAKKNIVIAKGAFCESRHTPSREPWYKPLDFYYNDGYKHISAPILSIVGENESVEVLNKDIYKKVITTRKSNGWECYGQMAVMQIKTNKFGEVVRDKDGSLIYEEITENGEVKTVDSATSFIPFKVITRTITQKLNYDNAPEDIKFEVVKGNKFEYKYAPAREGFTFIKWTKDQTGKEDDIPTVANEDITVYAQWKSNVATVVKTATKKAAAPKLVKPKASKKAAPKPVVQTFSLEDEIKEKVKDEEPVVVKTTTKKSKKTTKK